MSFLRKLSGRARADEEKSDLKSFDIYAQNIATELEENFGKDSDGYIFAISAKWGAGKTKLLKLMRPLLEARGYKVVTYNAWQYAQDPETLRRTFLKNLSKELNRNQIFHWFTGKDRSLARLDYEQTRTSISLPPPWGIVVIILIFAATLFIISGSVIKQSVGNALVLMWGAATNFVHANPFLSALVTFVISVLALPKLLQIQKKSSRITSTDEFEILFDQLVRRHGRVVIFIDDLDRCTPEGAKLVLDALKTFFLKNNVAYVVTGDHTVLDRYMGEQMQVSPVYDKEGNIDQKSTDISKRLEGQRFMQKIFNVYWKLPSLEPSEKDYLISKNLEGNAYLTEQAKVVIKALLVSYLDKTPREIIRFTRLLHFSLKTINTRLKKLEIESDDASMQIAANLRAVKGRPDLLAKILLMQEKFGGLFDYFSDAPNEYTDLEKRVIRLEQVQDGDSLWQDMLATLDYPRFIDFVKTPPTFHKSDGSILLVSSGVFFYYSGFAGPNNSGLISEDFLGRYVVPDMALKEDFSATEPKDNREKMLIAGIKHLGKITDTAQILQAVDHLLVLLEANLGHQELVKDLIAAPNLHRAWAVSDASVNQTLLTRLIKFTLKHEDAEAFDLLVNSSPWRSEMPPMWQHVDFSVINRKMMDVVGKYVNEEADSTNVNTVKRQFFDQNIKALSDADNRSEESLQNAVNRLADDPYEFGLNEFVDESTFPSILMGLLNLPENTGGSSALLDILNKNHKLWSTAPKPTKSLSYFRKNNRLHKTYGDQVVDIYSGWR